MRNEAEQDMEIQWKAGFLQAQDASSHVIRAYSSTGWMLQRLCAIFAAIQERLGIRCTSWKISAVEAVGLERVTMIGLLVLTTCCSTCYAL